MAVKPTLPEIQAAFAAFLAGTGPSGLAGAVVGDSISAEARLGVYRHHVRHSLTAALAATYPTVQALVGEAFFAAMARGFMAQALPRQPVLAEYGAGFAEFVAGYEPARGLPYLADMAKLDWALNVAGHNSAAAHLDAVALAAVPTEQLPSLVLDLAPGVTVIRSAYPIDLIWQASQPAAPADKADNVGEVDKVDLETRNATLLVLAGGFETLGDGEARFLSAVGARQSLERAAEAGLAADPAFDLSTCFARHLARGTFAALQQE